MLLPEKKPPLVIGFIGENANDSLGASTRYLNDILSSYGIQAHSVDLRDSNWYSVLRDLVTDRTPHFCYGYAGVGAGLQNGDNSFWSDYKTPFLSLMYDHPFCHPLQHKVASPYVANCYFIGDFLEVQLNYVKHPHQCFMMRDMLAPALLPDNGPADWHDRPIPYLLIKTGYDLARHDTALQALDIAERAIFDDCLHILQHSSDLHLTHLVAEHCRAKNIEPMAANPVFVKLTLLLERYIRDWRSWQLVEWLKYKPAVIIGNGWGFVDKTNTKAQFLSPIAAQECWSLYQKSRFVFNANPCFRDGCHERTLLGLYSGAIVVSDRNRFSDHVFAKLENFVGFDWADTDWREHLDTRLAEIESSGGAFDRDTTRRRLIAEFPLEAFVAKLLMAAQKIRDAAI